MSKTKQKSKSKKTDKSYIYELDFYHVKVELNFKVGMVDYTEAYYDTLKRYIIIYPRVHPSRFITTLGHELAHAFSTKHLMQWWYIIVADDKGFDRTITAIDESYSMGTEFGMDLIRDYAKELEYLDKEYSEFYITVGLPAIEKYLTDNKLSIDAKQRILKDLK